MLRLKAILKNRLKGARRLAILGIGSELRADDAAGVFIARGLQAYIKKKRQRPRSDYDKAGPGRAMGASVKVFLGETAPENLTGEIKKFKPTHLIIIDAIDSKSEAGTVSLFDAGEEDGVSFSTHRMPIKIIKDYLCKSIGCETVIIGIQPQSLDFSAALSPKVRRSAKMVAGAITEALKIP